MPFLLSEPAVSPTIGSLVSNSISTTTKDYSTSNNTSPQIKLPTFTPVESDISKPVQPSDWPLDASHYQHTIENEGFGMYCLDADILKCIFCIDNDEAKAEEVILERSHSAHHIQSLLFALATMMKVGETSVFKNSVGHSIRITVLDTFRREIVFHDKDSFLEVFLNQKVKQSRHRPEKFSRVFLHFDIKEYNSNIGESPSIFSSEKDAEFSFDLGSGDVPLALELGIMRFTLGQSGFIRASPDFFLGPNENNVNRLSDYYQMQSGGFVFGQQRAKVFCSEIESDHNSRKVDKVRVPTNATNQDPEETNVPDEEDSIAGDTEIGVPNPRFMLKPASVNLMQLLSSPMKNKNVLIDNVYVRRIDRLWDCTELPGQQHVLQIHLEQWKGCGNRMFRIGDWTRAAACYSGVLSRLDRLAPAAKYELGTLKQICMRNLAMSLLKINEKEKAKIEMDKVLKINPDDSKALYWLGRINLDKGSFIEAVELFNRASRIEPTNAYIKAAQSQAEAQASKNSMKWINKTAFVQGLVSESHTIVDKPNDLDDVRTIVGLESDNGVERDIALEGELDVDFLAQFGIKLS